MNLWWRYPFTKAFAFFLCNPGIEPVGIVLRIGPIAFGVWWQERKKPAEQPNLTQENAQLRKQLEREKKHIRECEVKLAERKQTIEALRGRLGEEFESCVAVEKLAGNKFRWGTNGSSVWRYGGGLAPAFFGIGWMSRPQCGEHAFPGRRISEFEARAILTARDQDPDAVVD